VHLIARGIATAVAPETGLTEVQADLLEAIASALTGVSVDYRGLASLGPDELADVLVGRDLAYRQRIVHHMVLGELVLRPIPTVVAYRVAKYSEALGVKDDFVRVARRYAQGAYGLAWKDLQRNGFAEHVHDAGDGETEGRSAPSRGAPAPFASAEVDSELAARWIAFEDLPEVSLGHSVWEMYDGRGFELPGTPGGAPAYLAQHDLNRNFTQTIAIRSDDPAPIIRLLEQWDLDQASADIMGYMGVRLLADRENPGQYLIIADFGVVDPEVSAADEANRSNERPQTQATAARLREMVHGEPEYRHYDELYRTDF
jgi:hypothetical protein